MYSSPEKLNKVARILKSMAHPLRIAIIEVLAQEEQLTVTEIYSELKIEQAEASRQLGILKRSKILKSKRSGKQMMYSINEPQILSMLDCIENCSI